jgi:DNA-directed RNA polymerase subunit M/transcription elongation factor TFIIS
MKLMMSCKEAAAMLVAREDRNIAVGDKLMLRLHLLACKACPNFEKQLLTMRNSMKQWRQYTEDAGRDDAVEVSIKP